MFKRNEGVLDRFVRISLGLVLTPIGLLVLGGLHGQAAGIVFTVLGSIALITGLTGFCPTYILFGIDTRENEKQLISRCRSMVMGSGSNTSPFASSKCWPGYTPLNDQQSGSGSDSK